MYKQKVPLNNVSAHKKLSRRVMRLRECLLAFPVRDSSFVDRRNTATGFAATSKNELLQGATSGCETLFSVFRLRSGAQIVLTAN